MRGGFALHEQDGEQEQTMTETKATYTPAYNYDPDRDELEMLLDDDWYHKEMGIPRAVIL